MVSLRYLGENLSCNLAVETTHFYTTKVLGPAGCSPEFGDYRYEQREDVIENRDYEQGL